MSFGFGGGDLGEFWSAFRLDMSDLKKGEAEIKAFSAALTANSREQMGLAKEQVRLEIQTSKERMAAERAVANEARATAKERLAQERAVEEATRRTAQATAGQIQLLQSAFGAVTAASIPAALHVRNLDLQFKNLVGSEEEAAKYLADIRQMAGDLNQPFLNLADSAAMLVPLVRQANVDLSQTMMISQRLRLIDPTARAYDAAIAIREFLSGEYLSMTRRFELPRARLSGIIQEAGGDSQKALDLLSDYLDELGITDQTLIQMGEDGRYTFETLQSNMTEMLGNAGRPLVEDFLMPAADLFSRLTEEVRRMGGEIDDTSPGLRDLIRLLEGVGGLIGLGFAARTSLSMGAGILGQFGLVGAGTRATLGALGGAAGQAGVLAGATAGGLGLGSMLVRDMSQYGTLGMNEAYANQGVGDVLGTVATAAAVGLSDLATRVGQVFSGEDLTQIDANKQATAEWMINLIGGADAVERFRGALDDATEGVKSAEFTVNRPFGQDVIDAYGQYRQNITDLNTQEQADRAETIADHIASVSEKYNAFLLEQTRENEDFQEGEAERLVEHRDKLADIQVEADQKQVEAYNKLYREIEQERRKHVYNLAMAAADLDAVAVANEKDRFALRMQELTEGFSEEQQQTDEQRVQKLEEEQAQFDLETDQRAAEFAKKQRRAQEDFDLEMAQMGAETNARLIAIGDRYNQERAAEEMRWAAEFEELTGHNVRMRDAYRAGLVGIEQELIAWATEQGINVANALRGERLDVGKTDRGLIGDALTGQRIANTVTPTDFTNSVISSGAYQAAITSMMGSGKSGPATSTLAGQHELSVTKTANAFESLLGGFQSGTRFVPRTGPYKLHEGEAVLNRGEAARYRSGGFANSGEIHVHIEGSTNMDESQIAAAVDMGLRRAFTEAMANG